MSDAAWTPGRRRIADALGHHASEVLIAAIVGVVLLPVAPLPGLLVLVVPLVLFAVVLASWLLMRQHDRRLCEPCMLSMPLNPSEYAIRYRRRFWVVHTGTKPHILIPYLVVLVGSNFATSTTTGRLCWAAIQLSMVYLVLATTTHRRFQPWCPWCRDGGGGADAEDLPPVRPDDRQLT